MINDNSLLKVKRELGSSSPPPSVEKRLVTCGTKRFAPIPHSCLPSCAEYKQNRLEWAANCVKELEALNLITGRRLFRDDGLVIDWRSYVPVWSDTLKPDPHDLAATIMLTHRSNAQRHRPVRKGSPSKSTTIVSTGTSISVGLPYAESPLKKQLLVPPRPLSRCRINPSQSISPDSLSSGQGCSSPELPEGETSRDRTSGLLDLVPIPSDTSSSRDLTGAPSKPLKMVCDQWIVPDTLSAGEEGVSEMTLNYLGRALVDMFKPTNLIGQVLLPHTLVRLRSDIVFTTLSKVSVGSHHPCWQPLPNVSSSDVAQVEYDMFYLGAKLGMFVICRVEDTTKEVVHNFILQRKEVDTEDARIEGVWPLTATVHQILIFQA